LYSSFEHHFFFVPRAKLIFCGIPKSGVTEWYSFLRFVHGAQDYLGSPHNNGDRGSLLFSSLAHEKASELLLDPTWTKGTFFGDAAGKRLLSAYLDKLVREHYTKSVFKIGLVLTFEEFVDSVTMEPNFVNDTLENIPIGHGLHAGTNPHWRPQILTCGLDNLLPHFDFVDNFSFVSEQTKLLLNQVGLWDDYGAKFDNGKGDYTKGGRCTMAPLALSDPGCNVSRVVSGFNQKKSQDAIPRIPKTSLQNTTLLN
jgi:hypothetical protein